MIDHPLILLVAFPVGAYLIGSVPFGYIIGRCKGVNLYEAGSGNIGKRYAMFEAIHGSAPRMVREGRAEYADASSLIRAGAMMLNHIGFADRGRKLEMALDICGQYEKKLVITGRPTGAKGADFANYLMETIQDPDLGAKWESYQPEAKAAAV